MTQFVKPKKHLGQHFLTDMTVAQRIVDTLQDLPCKNVLEIGPGKGILTRFIQKIEHINFKCIEIDVESVDYLQAENIVSDDQIVLGDFLQINPSEIAEGEIAVIGNFPYNISSQILFRIIENKEIFPFMSGMFQKEVAERVAANHGSKTYGILSVLIQSYYDAEYLFTVNEGVFFPPPKVKSGVLRLRRKSSELFPQIPYKFFAGVVKSIFGQRRKMLRNSLSSYKINDIPELSKFTTLRPEQLSVADFQTIAIVLKRNEK
jgi:16S rRNA (adenine1518-N6/adenine1519-N6)-dimethyltransferase